MQKNPNDETLVIRCWDFDEVKSMGQAMQTVGSIKSMEDFTKFVKDVAVKSISNKNADECFGSLEVPIVKVPVDGIEGWFELVVDDEIEELCQMKLHISFSLNKNYRLTMQEHCFLLDLLMRHEFQSGEISEELWTGNFSPIAKAIIRQHHGQNGLTKLDVAFAQWIVYAKIHQKRPISFEVFNKILLVLNEPMKSGKWKDEEDLSSFSESTKLLLPSCFATVGDLHAQLPEDLAKQLMHALSIIATAFILDPKLTSILPSLVTKSVQQKRPLEFFSNFREVLKIIETSFKNLNQPITPDIKQIIDDVSEKLVLYGSTTSELIHLYFKDRYAVQQAAVTTQEVLTVRCYFTDETLEVQIVGARDLVATYTDGSSDPFVSFNLYPEIENFDVSVLKTKCQEKTLCPFFDETFSM